MSAPRLVHVTTTDMSLELLLGPQLSAFSDAGFEVMGMSAPGPYVEHLARRGIAHVPLHHATRSMALGEDVRALAELRRRFVELRPDIVHTHNPKPGIYGRLAAAAAGVPTIVNTVHGLYATADDPAAKRAVVYGLERLASSVSHAELVQNPEDLPTLRRLGVDPRKLVLLGNGVDLSRFTPAGSSSDRARLRREWGVADDTVIVGAVGRLVFEKGYRELFEAWRAVSARSVVPCRLVVVGPDDPAKADALPAAVRSEAEATGVSFLGAREDVEALYRAFDVYVLASWREGFPRSAMEAAATGLPLVATDIRGCRQVVHAGRNGHLVPVRDPGALADALLDLINDAALRRRMGAESLTMADRFFDDRIAIERTLATYDRCRGTRTRRGVHDARRRGDD